MQCEIRYDILSRKQELYLWKELPDGEATCIKIHFTEERIPVGHQLAFTALPKEDGQAIFKALATALQKEGYLPESATNAELKATKYHLEDMRKMTFGLSEICSNVQKT